MAKPNPTEIGVGSEGQQSVLAVRSGELNAAVTLIDKSYVGAAAVGSSVL